VAGMLGQIWAAVNTALVHGYRGLPGGDSLRELRGRHRPNRRRRVSPRSRTRTGVPLWPGCGPGAADVPDRGMVGVCRQAVSSMLRRIAGT
jgi:hypothetical protein